MAAGTWVGTDTWVGAATWGQDMPVGGTTLTYTPPPGYVPTSLVINGQTVTAVSVGGLWVFSFTVPDGTYSAYVNLTGPISYQDPITVTVPTPGLNVQTLKKRLNYLDGQTQDDGELARFLAAAIEVVEGLCGPIIPRLITETVTTCTGQALLNVFPVASISSPTGATLAPGGVVRGLPYGTSTVTYIAGKAPTAAQMEAVFLVAADLWGSQNGQGTLNEDTGQYVLTPILHRRVRELLAPTMRAPSVA